MFTRRDKRLAYQRRISAKLRDRNRAIVKKAKSVPCKDCGGKFPTYCMDFDHVPGQGEPKVANIGSSIAKWASDPASLKKEIAKCDVICANCHRKRTFSAKRKAEVKKLKGEAKWGAKKQDSKQQDSKPSTKSGMAKAGKRKPLPQWDDSLEDEVPQY
jgi:hypothetical protein